MLNMDSFGFNTSHTSYQSESNIDYDISIIHNHSLVGEKGVVGYFSQDTVVGFDPQRHNHCPHQGLVERPVA